MRAPPLSSFSLPPPLHSPHLPLPLHQGLLTFSHQRAFNSLSSFEGGVDLLGRPTKKAKTIISIIVTITQVVQEYERAVIFRLGRLRPGGAKGPGIFNTDLSLLSFLYVPVIIIKASSL